ncbi:MAG: hypothetical protein IKC23_00570 [Fibrobacter sp.]|nr:hypothetical protein [Fibrobacter sp.]MBR2898108.1 hypothetical protein [Fibrobacter sp.]
MERILKKSMREIKRELQEEERRQSREIERIEKENRALEKQNCLVEKQQQLEKEQNRINQEKSQIEMERINAEKTATHQKHLEEQVAKEAEKRRLVEIREAEERAYSAKTQHLKAVEAAKEREHQRELDLREAERQKIIAQTQQMEAVAREEEKAEQRRIAEEIEAKERETAEAERMLREKKNRTICQCKLGSRILLALTAILMLLINYRFFYPDFDSTADYILLGIVVYVLIDVVALLLLAMSIRINKSGTLDIDGEKFGISTLVGLIPFTLVLLIDSFCIKNYVAGFFFDILEIAIATIGFLLIAVDCYSDVETRIISHNSCKVIVAIQSLILIAGIISLVVF